MATARPAADISFTGAEAGDDATHWELHGGSNSGTANNRGSLLWRDSLDSNTVALTANQFYEIASSALTITVNRGNGGATEAAARRAIDAIVDGTTHLVLTDNSATPADITDRHSMTTWTIANSS